VRLKRAKKRFEIACYKNKVLEYRSGVEKDLDNVLQIPSVFINVSKGEAAKSADLQKAFDGLNGKKGKDVTTDEIIMEILMKGELQVGEKERNAQLEMLQREVVDIVSGRLVDPSTKRVYTTGMIEKALDQLSKAGAKDHDHGNTKSGHASGTATPTSGDANGEGKGKEKELPTWTGVSTNKGAKSQALEAMKALIAHQPIPVARARMRLRITCPSSILKQTVKAAPKAKDDADDEDKDKATGTVKDKILSYVEAVETQDVLGAEWEVVGFVEPGAFKTLSEFIGTQTKGRARAEVLDMAVVHEDE